MHELQKNKENLQCGGVPEFQKYQISDDGDDVADKAADTAQNQVASAHEQTLNRLGNENVVLFLQKTDEHHDQTADHGNGVANEEQIHKNYLIKKIFVIVSICYTDVNGKAVLAKQGKLC